MTAGVNEFVEERCIILFRCFELIEVGNVYNVWPGSIDSLPGVTPDCRWLGHTLSDCFAEFDTLMLLRLKLCAWRRSI